MDGDWGEPVRGDRDYTKIVALGTDDTTVTLPTWTIEDHNDCTVGDIVLSESYTAEVKNEGGSYVSYSEEDCDWIGFSIVTVDGEKFFQFDFSQGIKYEIGIYKFTMSGSVTTATGLTEHTQTFIVLLKRITCVDSEDEISIADHTLATTSFTWIIERQRGTSSVTLDW